MEGFENLVYVEPEETSYIDIKTLSEAQSEFLNNTLPWWDKDRINFKGSSYGDNLFFHGEDKDWLLTVANEHDWVKLAFNDIFVEEM